MKGKLLLMSAIALAILAACDRPANARSGAAEGEVADQTSTPPASAQPASGQSAPGASASNQDASGQSASGQPSTMPAQSSADAKAGSPVASEGEALMLLMAVNDHEIAAADQARAKKVDGATLDYANLMRDEHGKNQADTRKLARAPAGAESDAVKAQKQKGAAELQTLSRLEGDAYEKAYIDAMVKGHTEVLAMLDARLIPAASTDPVRKHLTMTREHVAMHLERAKALQDAATR